MHNVYHCNSVTNCIGDGSFSVLKIIENYMKSIMKENHLNAIPSFNIEAELLK